MTTTLIIARHGNTFKAGETLTRVGARTDLPLVEEKRGKAIGKYLKNHKLIPDVVFSGPLKRHIQTAELAVSEMDSSLEIKINHTFIEIDYGPDENKSEADVIARIGQDAIDKWNSNAIVPAGWLVEPDKIIQSWLDFTNMLENKYKDKTVVIVSSNGIIRFAPHITGNFETFSKEQDIKVATGGICIFKKSDADKNWKCLDWNIKPNEL